MVLRPPAVLIVQLPVARRPLLGPAIDQVIEPSPPPAHSSKSNEFSRTAKKADGANWIETRRYGVVGSCNGDIVSKARKGIDEGIVPGEALESDDGVGFRATDQPQAGASERGQFEKGCRGFACFPWVAFHKFLELRVLPI